MQTIIIKRWIQRIPPEYRLPLAIAVIFHLILLILLCLHYQQTGKQVTSHSAGAAQPIISAVMINTANLSHLSNAKIQPPPQKNIHSPLLKSRPTQPILTKPVPKTINPLQALNFPQKPVTTQTKLLKHQQEKALAVTQQQKQATAAKKQATLLAKQTAAKQALEKAEAAKQAAILKEQQAKTAKQVELRKQQQAMKLARERTARLEQQRKQAALKQKEIEQQKKLLAEKQAVAAREKAEAETQARALAEKQAALKKAQAQKQAQLHALAAKKAQLKADAAKKAQLAKAQQQAKLKAAQLKQQALAAQQKKLQQQLMQQQLAAEQAEIAQQQMQAQIDQYTSQIRDSIRPKWLIPPAMEKNVALTVRITTSADGTVLDVKIDKTSGNPALDQLAIVAVFKSSPLPLPTDQDLAKHFHIFDLTMQPPS